MGVNKRSRIDYINSHRDAVGREPIPNDTSESELENHEKLIEQYAQFGGDPWASYVPRTVANHEESAVSKSLARGRIFENLDELCRRGGDVQVGPGDMLNPASGYQALVTEAVPWKTGYRQHRGSSDTSATEALAEALEKFRKVNGITR